MKRLIKKALINIEPIIENTIIATAIALSIFLVVYVTFRSVIEW